MNFVALIGRTTADTEIRVTNTNKKVCQFTLAVDDGKEADGSRRTQFIDCVAWEKSAEFMDRFIRKGTRIAVTGRLCKRMFESNGVKHYPTEVIAERIEFADGMQERPQEQPKSNYTKQTYTATTEQDFMKGIDINADDLPF